MTASNAAFIIDDLLIIVIVEVHIGSSIGSYLFLTEEPDMSHSTEVALKGNSLSCNRTVYFNHTCRIGSLNKNLNQTKIN